MIPDNRTSTPNDTSLEPEATREIIWNSPAESRIEPDMAKIHHSLHQQKSCDRVAHEGARSNGLENQLYEEGLDTSLTLLTKNPLYQGSGEADTVYSTAEELNEILPTVRKNETPVNLVCLAAFAPD